MNKIIFLICMFLILSGCKKDDSCLINYTFSGTVSDANGPLSGVEVHDVTHYGFDSIIATTDSNGKYSKFMGSYSDLGNEYIYYRKSGYKDYAMPVTGRGNGQCGDQTFVRDAVMSP